MKLQADPYREAHRRTRVRAALEGWDPESLDDRVSMAFDRACRESNVDHGFEDPDIKR